MCGIFSLVLVIKLGGRMSAIFQVGALKTDKGTGGLTEFITMQY